MVFKRKKYGPDGWPEWPISSQKKEDALLRVLRSSRWAISGDGTGMETEEEGFSREFARFTGATYCIPTDHGTSALSLAFQALGISKGDEVIIPGLTWVACASSVAALGAIPVLADINPLTLCIDAQSVVRRISPKTRAVLAVHLYCGIAPMEELKKVCDEHRLYLIEDCAQAHGARIRGRHVGTMGIIGVFSMQQGKTITCGEGGCCITSDKEIAEKLYRLRTDSRILGPRLYGQSELVPTRGLPSLNRCLSEFGCALLREELQELPLLHTRRLKAAAFFRAKISAGGSFLAPRFVPYASCEEAFYHLILFVKDTLLSPERPIDALADLLSEQLGFWVHPVYDPLDSHLLWCPESFGIPAQASGSLPNCHCVRSRALAFHHRLLLASSDQLDWCVGVCNQIIEGRAANEH